MDRERYMNDASYRKGYDDCRKDISSSNLTATMLCLNKLENEIKSTKKLLGNNITQEGV